MISYSYMYSATFIFHSTLFWRFVHVNVDLVVCFKKNKQTTVQYSDVWYTPIVRHLDYFQFYFCVWYVKWIWQRFLKEKINYVKIFTSLMPTFFRANENFSTQKQILPVGGMKLSVAQCIISKNLTVKQLFCVCNIFLISSLKYFFSFQHSFKLNDLGVFFLYLENIMCPSWWRIKHLSCFEHLKMFPIP